ncbi:MAG: heparinase II/III-family protein, partial [Armatimonadetes bacterium]|nr:heparinase II/III-family protein [Armatimonadota bacterium]
GLVFLPSDAELATAPAAPDLPMSTLYADMGWATLRSSWDKDATLLAVRSGYTWNHSHADAGSFILMHRGENLLIDSGKCSYGRPEYDSYYRQSRAHNVVLFNGEAQNPEDTYFGSKFPGTVSHLMDAGDLKYVLADATGPTAHWFIRNYRHFLWLGDVILIIDDLKTYEPGRFEWLLHVDGTAKVRGLDLEVAKGAARVLVRPLFPMPLPEAGYQADFPENMRLEERTGLQDRHPETEVTYYSFVAPEESRRTKFITALLLVDETNRSSLPQLERLEGTNYIGVRVRQGGSTTKVYLNLLADGRIMHRNANLKVNGWETDAYLTAITFPDDGEMTDPDAATRYFVAQGSYLRREGNLVLDSLSKVFLVAEQTTSGLNVLLQGQPVINAYLRSAQVPEAFRVNGVRRKVPYDAATKLVNLSVKEE